MIKYCIYIEIKVMLYITSDLKNVTGMNDFTKRFKNIQIVYKNNNSNISISMLFIYIYT